MPTIKEPTRPREVVHGRNNEVLSITDARVVMFKFTNGSGEVDVGMAFCFGKDQEDGGLGIYVIEPKLLQEILSIATPVVRDGVRKRLSALGQSAVPSDVMDPGEL